MLDPILVRCAFCTSFLVLMVASAWLGWFPVLFYSTAYISDLHKNASPIPQNHDAAIALDAEATRLGTRALLCNALVLFVANIIMPYFVASQHARHPASPLQPRPKVWSERVQIPLASLCALSHFLFAFCMLATLYVHHNQR